MPITPINRILDVYAASNLVGYLEDKPDSGLQFQYADEWTNALDAFQISPEFPVQQGVFVGQTVTDFFENLLPEGQVREFIEKSEHLSKGNIFGLLERLGGDTAGALSFLPHGQPVDAEPRYTRLTIEELKSLLQGTHGVPLGIVGDESRMSLSGAQDKATVFVDSDGSFLLPLDTAPSSHILKPSIDNRIAPCTAINEGLVMMLARRVGLNVPDVRYIPELDALLIHRYDRRLGSDGCLQRLHQNDLCQLAGRSSSKKYEAEGGLSLRQCFDVVLKYSAKPDADRVALAEWVVFNLVVGNMDSHAKNVSLLLDAERQMRIAPFYDLLSTRVYPNLSQKFAFKIGGENRPDWIMERHWQRFANEIGIKPEALAHLREGMAAEILNTLPVIVSEIAAQTSDAANLDMISKVSHCIEQEAGRLLARLPGLSESKEAGDEDTPELG